MEDSHWVRLRPVLEQLLPLGTAERELELERLGEAERDLADELRKLLRLEEGSVRSLEPPAGEGLAWLRGDGD